MCRILTVLRALYQVGCQVGTLTYDTVRLSSPRYELPKLTTCWVADWQQLSMLQHTTSIASAGQSRATQQKRLKRQQDSQENCEKCKKSKKCTVALTDSASR
jgi:hypothetical protein